MQYLRSIFSKDASVVNDYMFSPPQPPSYTHNTFPHAPLKLIWVPRELQTYNPLVPQFDHDMIPCLLVSAGNAENIFVRKTLMIYFHANAEDIGLTAKTVATIAEELHCHVLVPEYPGYGLCPGRPCETSIKATADAVYDWVTSKEGLRWPTSNLIICGRSIGSGPASYLASRKCVGVSLDRIPQCILPFYNCSYRDLDRPLLQLILKAEDEKYDPEAHTSDLRDLVRDLGVDVASYQTSQDVLPRASLVNLLETADVQANETAPNRTLLRVARAHNLLPAVGYPYPCAALVLLSPFESISKLVGTYAGKFAKMVISDRFNNRKALADTKCYVLLIHGAEDNVIASDHSISLWEACSKTNDDVYLKIVPGMTHNNIDVSRDVVPTILKVFRQLNFHPCKLVLPKAATLTPIVTQETEVTPERQSSYNSTDSSPSLEEWSYMQSRLQNSTPIVTIQSLPVQNSSSSAASADLSSTQL